MPRFVDENLLSEVFDGEKKDQAMALFTDWEDKIYAVAKEAVTQEMIDSGLVVPRKKTSKGQQAYRKLKNIFDNSGIDPVTGEKWTVQDFQRIDRELLDGIKSGNVKREDFADVQMSRDQPILFPKIVSEKVREALEPQLILTTLLQRINFSNGSSLSFPAVSSMTAGDLRITERGEYPEGKIQFAGQMTAQIGKHGIKVSMTEEAIRYSIMDIWGMNLRAAGRALARHKEMQVVDQIFNQGSNYFDNSTISGRKTTGRDMTGAFNGTFTQDDLFEMWADLTKEGYVPDLIIMHPFAWPIFARDPVLRNLAYMNGSGPVIANAYQGSPNAGWPHDLGGLGQERRFDEPANVSTTMSSVPSTFPFGSMRIIITPFVDYDYTGNFTTIYLCDSRDLGVIVVDEDVVTEEWKDPEHDVSSIKLRERYGIAASNAGRSVRKAKNVVVAKGYDFGMSTLQASVSLDTSELVVS